MATDDATDDVAAAPSRWQRFLRGKRGVYVLNLTINGVGFLINGTGLIFDLRHGNFKGAILQTLAIAINGGAVWMCVTFEERRAAYIEHHRATMTKLETETEIHQTMLAKIKHAEIQMVAEAVAAGAVIQH